MDFLKILISTLVIALITALVFLALYFVFPSVAEAQFGVSVNYAPERVPSSSLNGKLAAERDKADAKEAPPSEPREEITVESTVEGIVEKVTEVMAPKEEKKEEAPAAPEEVKKEEPKAETKPEAKAEAKAEIKAEPAVALTEGGKQIKDFMESTKMQVILSFLPDSVDAGALKKPSEWSDHDREQINKIGDYIIEHGIDIAKETKISNILKIVNSKEVPAHLQGLLDFVQNEVKF